MAKLYPIALSFFLMFMVQAVFQACVMDSEGSQPPSAKGTAPSSALSNTDQTRAKSTTQNPSLLTGCFMEWNTAKGDSTLACVDPTPPKMK